MSSSISSSSFSSSKSQAAPPQSLFMQEISSKQAETKEDNGKLYKEVMSKEELATISQLYSTSFIIPSQHIKTLPELKITPEALFSALMKRLDQKGLIADLQDIKASDLPLIIGSAAASIKRSEIQPADIDFFSLIKVPAGKDPVKEANTLFEILFYEFLNTIKAHIEKDHPKAFQGQSEKNACWIVLKNYFDFSKHSNKQGVIVLQMFSFWNNTAQFKFASNQWWEDSTIRKAIDYGFYASKKGNWIACFDGNTPCDENRYKKALEDIHSHLYHISNPHEVQNLVLRNNLLITRGGYCREASEIARCALDGLMKQYPLVKGENQKLSRCFTTHRDSHYPNSQVGKTVDLMNALTLFLKLPKDDFPPYCYVLTDACFINDRDPLASFSRKKPSNLISEMLTWVQGILLYEWSQNNKEVAAYEFPHSKNEIRLQISLNNMHFIGIDKTPVRLIEAFFNSWVSLDTFAKDAKDRDSINAILKRLNVTKITFTEKNKILVFSKLIESIEFPESILAKTIMKLQGQAEDPKSLCSTIKGYLKSYKLEKKLFLSLQVAGKEKYEDDRIDQLLKIISRKDPLDVEGIQKILQLLSSKGNQENLEINSTLQNVLNITLAQLLDRCTKQPSPHFLHATQKLFINIANRNLLEQQEKIRALDILTEIYRTYKENSSDLMFLAASSEFICTISTWQTKPKQLEDAQGHLIKVLLAAIPGLLNMLQDPEKEKLALQCIYALIRSMTKQEGCKYLPQIISKLITQTLQKKPSESLWLISELILFVTKPKDTPLQQYHESFLEQLLPHHDQILKLTDLLLQNEKELKAGPAQVYLRRVSLLKFLGKYSSESRLHAYVEKQLIKEIAIKFDEIAEILSHYNKLKEGIDKGNYYPIIANQLIDATKQKIADAKAKIDGIIDIFLSLEDSQDEPGMHLLAEIQDHSDIISKQFVAIYKFSAFALKFDENIAHKILESIAKIHSSAAKHTALLFIHKLTTSKVPDLQKACDIYRKWVCGHEDYEIENPVYAVHQTANLTNLLQQTLRAQSSDASHHNVIKILSSLISTLENGVDALQNQNLAPRRQEELQFALLEIFSTLAKTANTQKFIIPLCDLFIARGMLPKNMAEKVHKSYLFGFLKKSLIGKDPLLQDMQAFLLQVIRSANFNEDWHKDLGEIYASIFQHLSKTSPSESLEAFFQLLKDCRVFNHLNGEVKIDICKVLLKSGHDKSFLHLWNTVQQDGTRISMMDAHFLTSEFLKKKEVIFVELIYDLFVLSNKQDIVLCSSFLIGCCSHQNKKFIKQITNQIIPFLNEFSSIKRLSSQSNSYLASCFLTLFQYVSQSCYNDKSEQSGTIANMLTPLIIPALETIKIHRSDDILKLNEYVLRICSKAKNVANLPIVAKICLEGVNEAPGKWALELLSNVLSLKNYSNHLYDATQETLKNAFEQKWITLNSEEENILLQTLKTVKDIRNLKNVVLVYDVMQAFLVHEIEGRASEKESKIGLNSKKIVSSQQKLKSVELLIPIAGAFANLNCFDYVSTIFFTAAKYLSINECTIPFQNVLIRHSKLFEDIKSLNSPDVIKILIQQLSELLPHYAKYAPLYGQHNITNLFKRTDPCYCSKNERFAEEMDALLTKADEYDLYNLKLLKMNMLSDINKRTTQSRTVFDYLNIKSLCLQLDPNYFAKAVVRFGHLLDFVDYNIENSQLNLKETTITLVQRALIESMIDHEVPGRLLKHLETCARMMAVEPNVSIKAINIFFTSYLQTLKFRRMIQTYILKNSTDSIENLSVIFPVCRNIFESTDSEFVNMENDPNDFKDPMELMELFDEKLWKIAMDEKAIIHMTAFIISLIKNFIIYAPTNGHQARSYLIIISKGLMQMIEKCKTLISEEAFKSFRNEINKDILKWMMSFADGLRLDKGDPQNMIVQTNNNDKKNDEKEKIEQKK